MLFSLDAICYAWASGEATSSLLAPQSSSPDLEAGLGPVSDSAGSGIINSGSASTRPRPGLLLDGASFTLSVKERLAITGDNGAGKSTLLHIGAGLLRPLSGRVSIMGSECKTEKDFQKARQHLGYLLQRAEDQLFCPTVLEDVAFGLYNYGASRAEAAAKARLTLDSLGLLHLADRNGSRLSGGEGKLAALAAVLATDPQFLFLDEPTNDLDKNARTRLLDLLDRIALPFVFVSHDSEFVQAMATRTCLLHEGRLL